MPVDDRPKSEATSSGEQGRKKLVASTGPGVKEKSPKVSGAKGVNASATSSAGRPGPASGKSSDSAPGKSLQRSGSSGNSSDGGSNKSSPRESPTTSAKPALFRSDSAKASAAGTRPAAPAPRPAASANGSKSSSPPPTSPPLSMNAAFPADELKKAVSTIIDQQKALKAAAAAALAQEKTLTPRLSHDFAAYPSRPALPASRSSGAKPDEPAAPKSPRRTEDQAGSQQQQPRSPRRRSAEVPAATQAATGRALRTSSSESSSLPPSDSSARTPRRSPSGSGSSRALPSDPAAAHAYALNHLLDESFEEAASTSSQPASAPTAPPAVPAATEPVAPPAAQRPPPKNKLPIGMELRRQMSGGGRGLPKWASSAELFAGLNASAPDVPQIPPAASATPAPPAGAGTLDPKLAERDAARLSVSAAGPRPRKNSDPLGNMDGYATVSGTLSSRRTQLIERLKGIFNEADGSSKDLHHGGTLRARDRSTTLKSNSIYGTLNARTLSRETSSGSTSTVGQLLELFVPPAAGSAAGTSGSASTTPRESSSRESYEDSSTGLLSVRPGPGRRPSTGVLTLRGLTMKEKEKEDKMLDAIAQAITTDSKEDKEDDADSPEDHAILAAVTSEVGDVERALSEAIEARKSSSMEGNSGDVKRLQASSSDKLSRSPSRSLANSGDLNETSAAAAAKAAEAASSSSAAAPASAAVGAAAVEPPKPDIPAVPVNATPPKLTTAIERRLSSAGDLHAPPLRKLSVPALAVDLNMQPAASGVGSPQSPRTRVHSPRTSSPRQSPRTRSKHRKTASRDRDRSSDDDARSEDAHVTGQSAKEKLDRESSSHSDSATVEGTEDSDQTTMLHEHEGDEGEEEQKPPENAPKQAHVEYYSRKLARIQAAHQRYQRDLRGHKRTRRRIHDKMVVLIGGYREWREMAAKEMDIVKLQIEQKNAELQELSDLPAIVDGLRAEVDALQAEKQGLQSLHLEIMQEEENERKRMKKESLSNLSVLMDDINGLEASSEQLREGLSKLTDELEEETLSHRKHQNDLADVMRLNEELEDKILNLEAANETLVGKSKEASRASVSLEDLNFSTLEKNRSNSGQGSSLLMQHGSSGHRESLPAAFFLGEKTRTSLGGTLQALGQSGSTGNLFKTMSKSVERVGSNRDSAPPALLALHTPRFDPSDFDMPLASPRASMITPRAPFLDRDGSGLRGLSTPRNDNSLYFAIRKCAPHHPAAVRCLCAADSGMWAGCADGTIRIWNIQSGQVELERKLHAAAILDMKYIQEKVWTTSKDGQLLILSPKKELKSGHKMAYPGKKGSWATVLLEVGDWVWSGGSDGVIRVWDSRGKVQKKELHEGECISAMQLKGNEVWVAVDMLISVLSADTFQSLMVLDDHQASVLGLSVVNQTDIWSVSSNGLLCCWSDDKKCIATSDLSVPAPCLMEIKGEGHVWTGGSRDLVVWSSMDATVIQPLKSPHTDIITCFAQDKLGQFWTGSQDLSVCIWKKKAVHH